MKVLTRIRSFVVVQRVGAAGVVVGQRSVVVVILVTLLQLSCYFTLDATAAATPASSTAATATTTTVHARMMVVVVFAQQRVVTQRELVAGYELPAARVAPEALHVINFSLGPHHEFGSVEAQVALITFGAK